MVVFFDTNVYIDLLKGRLDSRKYQEIFSRHVVRICPVVYHELLRGIRNPKVLRKVESTVKKIHFLSSPTTNMWIQAAHLAVRVVQTSDAVSLSNMQNDLLIALTARESGATLITRDRHFMRIRKHLVFEHVLLL